VLTSNNNDNLLNYALRNGDDRLILAHRLGEWCGSAPILEEDIALTNVALDVLGQSILFYKYAAELEGTDNDEDFYAYKRGEQEFRNLLLTEQPNEDFAYTIARQFYFDTFDYYFFDELTKSKNSNLSAIAEKSIKEAKYHLRHSSQWMLRLGDGTTESNSRINDACGYLWMYTGELFENQSGDEVLIESVIIPDLYLLHDNWLNSILQIKKEAGIALPDEGQFMQKGGRIGKHTEYLGHIISDMQYLSRVFPNAKW